MKHKTYVVTGGTSGIGLAVVTELIKEGHRVISLSRSQTKIDGARALSPSIHDGVDFLLGDAANSADIEKLFRFIEDNYGVVHGLVNNAATLNRGTLETTPVADWERVMQVNLNGPFMMTRAMLPLMKCAEGASVVNISSVASIKPGTSLAYSVSKAGLDMFTKYLAGELGHYGIRVNAVNPGLIRTNLHYDNQIVADKAAYDAMVDKALNRYPLGKVGEPADIAGMVLYLLSEKARWITGSIITVDGGLLNENTLRPPPPEA